MMGGGCANSTMMKESKKQSTSSMHMQPDSLMSISFYEGTQQQQQHARTLAAPGSNSSSSSHTGQFFPVDEYRDLSLREMLDITDELIFDDTVNVDLFGEYPFAEPALSSSQQPTFTTSDAAQVYWPSSNPLQIESQTLEIQMSQYISRGLTDPTLTAATTRTHMSITSCMDLSPKKKNKRSRSSAESENGESPEDHGADIKKSPNRCFRSYQIDQWSEKFQELCEYRQKMGHCLIPHTFTENLPLARWVKRQRYQYKLMMKNGRDDPCGSGTCSSAMTQERVLALEDIGFVWDSQGAAWGERLSELNEFYHTFSHCNVPSNFPDNPQLATWVKCQRRQYKVYMEGNNASSNMTPQRIRELENLGFEWELRCYNKKKKKARTSI